ncbi:hypothetical protein FGB62_55g152 [Gracilaria domingensis]|nr:hypothetical protein FGB62_55g152 [Gracilaria domingensis]
MSQIPHSTPAQNDAAPPTAEQGMSEQGMSLAASFVNTPLRVLQAKVDAPLMSGVLRDGSRRSDNQRLSVTFPIQSYIIRNNRTLYDRGENTIYVPPPNPRQDVDFFKQCLPLFKATIVRDGSILGYIIHDVQQDRSLLKVHFHGDTTNPFSRAFKAFVRSPVLKWDVENWGLFQDLPVGANLGLIQEVYPDNRVFFPTADTGMPRLEMQYAASLGLKYYFAVTDIPEPIGEVDSSLIARFAPRSEAYLMSIRNCTREEAVLWFTMVIATDMKRRKVQNTKYGPGLPLYAL